MTETEILREMATLTQQGDPRFPDGDQIVQEIRRIVIRLAWVEQEVRRYQALLGRP